jgi:exopolyphosphatase/guanosine-5'-triphosphate,3'-diphosphate pyrophosphatase
MRVTRLGEGVQANGVLAKGAMARTLGVLADYRRTADSLGVSAARLVATSAVRDAANGAEFLAAAGDVVGVDAELLSGAEEGRLAYAGATADLAPGPGDDVVVDIGGGSTELVVRHGHELGAVSLDLGCVRLTERYFHHDPPTAGELAAAEEAIRLELDRAAIAVPALDVIRVGRRLLGLAGTVSTLTMLDQGMARYERDRVHHAVLDRRTVSHWCEVLAAEPSAARARRPGMDPGREDVIVGGVIVLREVMDRFGFVRCVVSEADILDGLVLILQT